jgi:hypothetical protein
MINYQNLNNQLEWQEYPLMLVKEIFQSIGCFVYTTRLDLNMGYLHMNLAKSAHNIITVVMSFDICECTKLLMGVLPAMDIFQSRMVSIFCRHGT